MKDEFDIWESPTWLDSREFREYRRLVESVVEKAAARAKRDPSFRGVTTRYIHERLGANARHSWTQDALDGSRLIEGVGVSPTYLPSETCRGSGPDQRKAHPSEETKNRRTNSMNNTQQLLNDQQKSLIADLVQTYNISPDEITYFSEDPEPGLGYEASCVMANTLVPDLQGIDVSPIESAFDDSLSIKCELTFANGRKRSAVGVVNINEAIGDAAMTPQQRYQTGTSRAIRNVLRVAGIDLLKLHYQRKNGLAGQYPASPRTHRQSLLAQAHALGREAGLIIKTPDEKLDKQIWRIFLWKRYGVDSCEQLSDDLLSDFIAVLRSIAPAARRAA